MTPEITKAINAYRAAVRESNKRTKQLAIASEARDQAQEISNTAHTNVHLLRQKMLEIIGQR